MENTTKESPGWEPDRFKTAVAEEVELARFALRFKSRFVAGVVCCFVTLFLSYSSEFNGLGPHSNLWATLIGLALGFLMGERVVFFLLGCLVTWTVLTKHAS